MGFLTEGGLAGFGGAVNRGVDIRKDTVEEQLNDFDKLVVAGGEKLDIGMANAKKKNEIKDILMRRLKTTNAGLVLSELENSFDFDGAELVKIKPTDINDIEKRIIFSVADITEESRDVTKIKSGYTPPNITPFAGKLTGAAATRYEIAEEYAKRNGVPIEIALQRANFESIETGIPGSGPRNIQTTGRAGVPETTGKGTSTDFNIERNLNDPAYTYDVYDSSGNITTKTDYESSGERKYILTESLGRLDNISNVNRQVDDVMFSNFGIYGQVDPRSGEVTISSGDSPKEKFNFAASQHAQKKAKTHISAIFSRFGEITPDTISTIANEAYEDFWEVFEKPSNLTLDSNGDATINNLHLHNNISDDVIKYGNGKTVENPYKNIELLSKRKEAFYQDLKISQGEGAVNTFKLFANELTQTNAPDGYAPRNRGSSTAYRKSRDTTTRLVNIVLQQSADADDPNKDTFIVYFNDNSKLEGTRAELARYL